MFVALIVGFTMAVYAGTPFGTLLVIAALLLLAPLALALGRRYSLRDLLISIDLAWAAGMVATPVSFGFPDRA